jgi:hypothetical protein
VQFRVITADDEVTLHGYGTAYKGSYEVLDNAVLVVHPKDGSHPTVRLSPAYWRQIIEPSESAH